MNNMIEFIKQRMGMSNPKDLAMQMLRNNNNPILNNLMQNIEKGDTKSVETFARNLFKEQGRDFDKEFGSFMNNFRK